MYNCGTRICESSQTVTNTLRVKACSDIPKRRLQTLLLSVVWVAVRTPPKRLDCVCFQMYGQVTPAVRSLALLRDHDSRRNVWSASPSSRICVPVLTVSATRPTSHHTDTRPVRMQQEIITTVIHPAAVQQYAMSPSFHVSCSIPQGTTISLAAACRTSVIAARARDAPEMNSVSIAIFGAELGRPLMRLMLNKSHNIMKRFPSRRFVIKSAGFTVPRIFPILSSWFFFLLQPKVLCLHVFDGAPPTAESQPSCCCSIRPDSYVSLVIPAGVGQPDGLTRTAYHAVVFWLGAAQRHYCLDRLLCCQGVLSDAQTASRC